MHKVVDKLPLLTENAARGLLKAKGYGMNCPFGHVHATQGNREWHVCMLDALADMEVLQFFECLHAALSASEQVRGPYISLVDIS